MDRTNHECALYHRVSTHDQDEQAAVQELHRASGLDGWRAQWIITETGSGSRRDRPGLHALMKQVRRRRVKAIYTWKIDRFARSALDLLALLRELERFRVRFVAVSDGIDVRPGESDPASTLLVQVLGSVAEFERSLIRERTRLGLQRAKARGSRLGRPVKDGPDPAEVRHLRARGLSWRQIATAMSTTVYRARRAIGLRGPSA